VIEGDFGGAVAGSALTGDVTGSDADAGLTAGAGSLGEAAVDQGPGPNGSGGANEAYASSVTDGEDFNAAPAPPARVWERVRDSDRDRRENERRESERAAEGGQPDASRVEAKGGDAGRQPNGGRGPQGGGGGGRRDAGGPGQSSEGPSAGGPAGSPPAALRFISDVFHRPGIVQRWPLYLRQVKQILRSVDESFDERRYGFTGIVEALRYCQREGLFRLDRDRQGVLRVYPGPVLQRVATAAPQHAIDTEATPGNVAPAALEDDDNRGNRIQSGERYERGGRGGRDRGGRDREERAARGDRSDRGDRPDQGDRGDSNRDARPRREERPEFGEPLQPGTMDLFPLTEATADADSEANADATASHGDGAHGPLTDDTTAVSPADADVMSGEEASASAADSESRDEEGAGSAPAGKRKRTGRGGRSAKKTAAKASSKPARQAGAAEKRAPEKPATEKPSSKPRASKNTRARKAAKSSGA